MPRTPSAPSRLSTTKKQKGKKVDENRLHPETRSPNSERENKKESRTNKKAGNTILSRMEQNQMAWRKKLNVPRKKA